MPIGENGVWLKKYRESKTEGNRRGLFRVSYFVFESKITPKGRSKFNTFKTAYAFAKKVKKQDPNMFFVVTKSICCGEKIVVKIG